MNFGDHDCVKMGRDFRANFAPEFCTRKAMKIQWPDFGASFFQNGNGVQRKPLSAAKLRLLARMRGVGVAQKSMTNKREQFAGSGFRYSTL